MGGPTIAGQTPLTEDDSIGILDSKLSEALDIRIDHGLLHRLDGLVRRSGFRRSSCVRRLLYEATKLEEKKKLKS